MNKNYMLEKLIDVVVKGDKYTAPDIANEALGEGIDPYEAIVNGLSKGMSILGNKYDNGEAYVPDLLLGTDAMYAGMDVLNPYLKVEDTNQSDTVVLGVIEGDIHDIGKSLVKTMVSISDFNVIDLGADVSPEDFVETAKEYGAKAISISSLMTTTMSGMETVIDILHEKDLRDSVKVIVGGAPVTEKFANKIGADSTQPDASKAASWLASNIK
ncbi:hypothetical protein EFE42_08540 [Methanohalophilus sp. RSK]|uniref:corrinoid protein n=1 Tax=Methanohalophilus sp. RSK TaxID=2485783 RepID=UPI000F43C82E|nr:corrinoid protein [Methanohalophilus sp. RSK]RNI12447.1 hypothetical protein EFE42_08540 [Methanohalophilus sp. RSK]